MYEDFLELSTRYDDQKMDRDEILRSIQENFLNQPELKDMSGFKDDENQSVFGDDIDFMPKLKSLFRVIRGMYIEYQAQKESSPLKSKNNLYDTYNSINTDADKIRLLSEAEELRNNNMDFREEIVKLNNELKEAGDMIKVMDSGMQELNSEIRKLKMTKSEQIDDFGKKENELETEIAELCEEVTTYRRMAEERGKELNTLKSSTRDIQKKLHDQGHINDRNTDDLKQEVITLESDNKELLQEIQNFRNLLSDSESITYNKSLTMVSIKREHNTEKKKLEDEIEKQKIVIQKNECINGTPSPEGKGQKVPNKLYLTNLIGK